MLSESHPFHSHGTYEVAAASSSLSSGASSGMKLVRATYLLPPALPFSTSSSSLSTGEDRRPSDAPLSMPQEEGNRDAPQLSSSSSEALLLLSQQRSSSRQPSEIIMVGEDAFESDTQEMPIVAGQTEQQQEQQQRVSLAHSSSSSTSSAMVPVSNASSDAATEVIVVSEPSSILVRGNTTTIAATSAAVAGDHPHGRAGPANGSDDRESISSVSAASSSPHRRGSRRQLLPQMQAPNSTQHLLPFSGQYNNSAAQSSFSENELYAQSTGSLSDRAGGGSDGSRAAPHRQTSSSFTSSPRLAAVAFLSSNEMPLCEDPCLQNSASCRRAPPAVVATGGGTLSPGGNRIAGFSLRSSGYYYGGRGYSNNTNSRPSAFFARDPLNESNGSSGSVAALSPFVASSSLTSVFQTSSAGLPLREAAAAEEWDLPRMLAPPRRWSDSEVVPLPPTLHREGTKRTYRCALAESPGDRQRDEEEGEPATARSTTKVIHTGSPSHHSHHHREEEEKEEAAAVDEDDVVPVIHFADAALLEDDVPPLRFSIAQPMPSSGGEGGMVGGCRPSHITATRTISGSAANECSATAETTSCLWELGLVQCTNPNDAPFTPSCGWWSENASSAALGATAAAAEAPSVADLHNELQLVL